MHCCNTSIYNIVTTIFTLRYTLLYLSTKPGRQSIEGYAQGSRLSTDRCASHERDGDAEQHASLPRFKPPCGCNTLCPALLGYCCLKQRITS
jgi:hypothetical protein